LASFRGSLCFASLSAKKYGTPYFFRPKPNFQDIPDAEEIAGQPFRGTVIRVNGASLEMERTIFHGKLLIISKRPSL
jgi:hypothetical protein